MLADRAIFVNAVEMGGPGRAFFFCNSSAPRRAFACAHPCQNDFLRAFSSEVLKSIYQNPCVEPTRRLRFVPPPGALFSSDIENASHDSLQPFPLAGRTVSPLERAPHARWGD